MKIHKICGCDPNSLNSKALERGVTKSKNGVTQSCALVSIATLVKNYRHSEIEDIADTDIDELSEQVVLGELDVVKSCIDERQDISEESFGVARVPLMIQH